MKTTTKPEAEKALNIIPASTLAPTREVPASDAEFWFWCGLRPDCPVEHLDLGGINFPKVTQAVGRDPETGETIRVPLAGNLVKLTRPRIELIATAIASRVLRFMPRPGAERVSPSTVVLDKARPPKLPYAMLVRIPTVAEAAAARQQHGRRFVPYIAADCDRHVGDFVYCAWVDEAFPVPRGPEVPLPPVVSKVGIPLPPHDARPVPFSEGWAKPEFTSRFGSASGVPGVSWERPTA